MFVQADRSFTVPILEGTNRYKGVVQKIHACGPLKSAHAKNVSHCEYIAPPTFIGIQSYKKTTYIKTQYKPKILHNSDPSLSSNGPDAIPTRTTIPPDKPLSHAPARISMAFSLPPSMKSKSVVIPILMSAHVKIFRP